MYVHCPNCQSSFEVNQKRLPAPKYNTAYDAFGWKFECGHCDTQWWVCLMQNARSETGQPRQGYNLNDPLSDVVHPSSQRSMAPDARAWHKISKKNAHNVPPRRHTPHERPLSAAQAGYDNAYTDPGFGRGAQYGPSMEGAQLIAPKKGVSGREKPFHLGNPKAKRLKPKRWLRRVLYILLFCAGVLTFEYHYPRLIRQTIAQISVPQLITHIPNFLQSHQSNGAHQATAVPPPHHNEAVSGPYEEPNQPAAPAAPHHPHH